MGHQRFLDIHLGHGFGLATFPRDVPDQEKHQTAKEAEHRTIIVDEISVRRDVTLKALSDDIAWVCAAGGERGGKLRINSHGDTRGCLSTGRGPRGILATDFAAYLAKHGLTAGAMGKPGLTTISLACCYSASGPKKDWMIRNFADELKLPGVKVTGAAAITRMEKGKLMVRYEPYVPAGAPYVPPHKRRLATSVFSGSVFKHDYTYAG